MSTYVAFLRGMNLGRRRIKNEELCACFERMGYEGIEAFLASGNVIFQSNARSPAKLEASIERELERQLLYEVPTFVRSGNELRAICSAEPYDQRTVSETAGKLQVALLSKKPSPAAKEEALALAPKEDRLAVSGRELYWLPRSGVSDSYLDMKALARALGPMTIRTHRTLVRLSAKLDEGMG